MSAYRSLSDRLADGRPASGRVAYNRPPMSDQSRQSRTRAEARRRARLAASGQPIEDGVDDETPPVRGGTTVQGGSFLRRMFPPAAPLPGKPDPLAGFRYQGPLRGVVSTAYLLARHPLVWIAMGLLWALCYSVTTFYAGSIFAVVTSLGTFVALVAAGWLGWPRPWAFGAAAALLGFLGYAAILTALALNGVDIDGPDATIPPTQAAVSLAVNGLFMVAVGALAGFYGGYLRRRLAEPRPGGARPRRR